MRLRAVQYGAVRRSEAWVRVGVRDRIRVRVRVRVRVWVRVSAGLAAHRSAEAPGKKGRRK